MQLQNNINSVFMSILHINNSLIPEDRLKAIFTKYDNILHEMVDSILFKNETKLNTDGCLINLIDVDNNHFTYRATSSVKQYFENKAVLSEDSICTHLGVKSDAIYNPNIALLFNEKSPTWQKWSSSGINSVIVIPFSYKQHPLGSFIVFSKKEDAFSEYDIEVAKIIGGYIHAAFGDVISDLENTIHLEEKQVQIESTEENLKMAQECQSLIFNSISDAIIIFDLDYIIVDWNPAAEKIFGYFKSEVVGKSFDVLTEFSGANIIADIKEHMLNKQEWHGDIQIIRANNKPAFYEMNIVPLQRESGDIIAVLSVGRDITAKRLYSQLQEEHQLLLEKSLKKSNVTSHLFEQALEQTDDIVVITTADMDLPGPTIIYVNAAFEKITGYTREEVIGQTPRILQGANSDTQELQKMKQVVQSGNIYYGCVTNYTKDGKEFELDWSISPIIDETNTITHYIAVQRKRHK